MIRSCLANPTWQPWSCRLQNDGPRPFPHSINLCSRESPTCRPVTASATLHQRRWNTKLLDAVQNRCGQSQVRGCCLNLHTDRIPRIDDLGSRRAACFSFFSVWAIARTATRSCPGTAGSFGDGTGGWSGPPWPSSVTCVTQEDATHHFQCDGGQFPLAGMRLDRFRQPAGRTRPSVP